MNNECDSPYTKKAPLTGAFVLLITDYSSSITHCVGPLSTRLSIALWMVDDRFDNRL